MLDIIEAPMQALDTTHFIRNYWQKKPLLIRGAFAEFSNPLSADELAGLAMEENVESRIVRELASAPYWQVDHGSFEASTFATLPATNWTLLVQDVEKHLPDLAPFLDNFLFLPAWRIDDLMISAAADGGSVGPHLDSYDVFLLQAEGKREWRLASQSDGVMLQDLEFGVLANFSAAETVLLKPGDMLYLPPEIAHHGIARGECMTWSIGFRAPDLGALLPGYTEWQLATQSTRRYGDADLEAEEARNGKLSPAAIQRARNIVQPAFDPDETQFARWFGCYVTEPKHWLRAPPPGTRTTADTLAQRLRNGEHLERNSLSRFTFSVHGNILYLYFDGHDRKFRAEQENLLIALCSKRRFSVNDLPGLDNQDSAALLADLFNLGCLLFVEPDHE